MSLPNRFAALRRTLVAGLVLASCSGESDGSSTPPPAPAATVTPVTFPEAPTAPDGPNDEATARFDEILATIPAGSFDVRDVQAFIDVADARHAGLSTDEIRQLLEVQL